VAVGIMTLYSAPPPARDFHHDKPTLLVCWWCTCFAAVIILFRVCGRYIRTERLFREDWIAFACLIPLFARMALVHVILLYGTNNTVLTGLSELSVHRRILGSKLVLVSRIFYAATLWTLKYTISEFFKRLTIQIWRRSHERMLVFIRWFLLASFIAIIIADIAECQPVTHYWQVSPDPGPKCRQGYAQLLTMGTANVITDLLLVVFPIPIIIRSAMPIKRKIQLVLLFALSIVPVAVTLYRIPHIIQKHGSQQYRSLLASVEILFATGVANALVLGSFVRDRGVKKQRWKFGSMSDSIERTSSRRGTMVRHWGSDEDLVRDLGLSVDPELRGSIPSPVARPAPMAVAGMSPVQGHIERNWQFPTSRSNASSEETDLLKIPEEFHSPSDLSFVATPRKISFFDVGGLLEEHPLRRGSSISTENEYHSFASTNQFRDNSSPQVSPRKGSSVFLQDVGGLLSTGPRTQRNLRSESHELQTFYQERTHSNANPLNAAPMRTTRRTTTHSLQDVGGLLR
jgi:hypothetical protein